MAEITTCPKCQRKLQVPDQFFGQAVQCPQCQHRFVAAETSVSEQPLPSASSRSGQASSGRRGDDDDSSAGRPRQVRYDDDEDDDDLDRRRIRRHYAPHRGGVILTLGLVSLVGGLSFCLPIIIGPVAWALGTRDLREMRERRMDPSGEGMTRAGQVCGGIATVLMIPAGCIITLAIFG